MLRNLVGVLLAVSAASPARAEWYEAKSKHFIVYSDDSPANVQANATSLEQFDQAIRVWHMAPEEKRGPSTRVTVFFVKDTDAVARLAGSSGVAGFYRPTAGESVAFSPRSGGGDLGARAILFHEYTHHWMLTNWTDAAMPPWFVEGFAELHATAVFRGNQIIFGAVPIYRRYSIGQMNAMPMDRMLKFDLGTLSPLERDALYSHGWALSHYLTFDPERRKQLAAYIGALNGGKAGDPAKLIGNGHDIDIALQGYVRRPRLPSAAFALDTLKIGDIQLRKMTAGEAAIMPALIRSKAGVNARTAPAAVALARQLAAGYPNDPFVQNELAEAELDACDVDAKAPATCFAAVETATDRALAADPKSIHALVYKGKAQIAALERGKVKDVARWKAARQWFLAANKVDTETPQPLIDYYASFRAAGEPATANAQAALLYAYALAPYDADVRLQATQVYLQQNNAPAARIAIMPVAYNIESRGKAAYAKKALDAIDAGDTKGALAALTTKPTPKDDDEG